MKRFYLFLNSYFPNIIGWMLLAFRRTAVD
jgi:hypothetical protein